MKHKHEVTGLWALIILLLCALGLIDVIERMVEIIT